jgi:hypothetical protein
MIVFDIMPKINEIREILDPTPCPPAPARIATGGWQRIMPKSDAV